MRLADGWFKPLTFHVAGFLLLPFLAPRRDLSWAKARDLATRYLVPFVAAVLVYAVAYQAVIARSVPDLAWLGRIGTAVLVAAPAPLQDATGYVVLWFLPALLTTTLLIMAYDAASPPGRAVLLAAAIGVHCFVGAAPDSVKSGVPQGMLIALWMLPLGLTARAAMPLLEGRTAWISAVAPLVLIACALPVWGVEIEIGTLDLPTIARPIWLMASDISDLAYLALIIAAAPIMARVPFLTSIGRESLLIYLIHPLLYKPILAALLPVGAMLDRSLAGGWLLYWAVAAVSVIVVTAASLAAASGLRRLPAFEAFATPRDWPGWPPARMLRG